MFTTRERSSSVLRWILPVGEEEDLRLGLKPKAISMSLGRLVVFLGCPRATSGPGGGVASTGSTSSFLESFFFLILGTADLEISALGVWSGGPKDRHSQELKRHLLYMKGVLQYCHI